jgi:hypothetical protein
LARRFGTLPILLRRAANSKGIMDELVAGGSNLPSSPWDMIAEYQFEFRHPRTRQPRIMFNANLTGNPGIHEKEAVDSPILTPNYSSHA